MNTFKVTLVNKTNSIKIHLELIYEPETDTEIEFRFGNASKSLERNDLKFMDQDLKRLEPAGFTIINPIKNEIQEMIISNTRPFIYDIFGEITHHDSKALIKLVNVDYLLEKGKKYFIQLNSQGVKSNVIEFEIN